MYASPKVDSFVHTQDLSSSQVAMVLDIDEDGLYRYIVSMILCTSGVFQVGFMIA